MSRVVRKPRLGVISPFPPEISGVGQYGWHLTAGLAATQQFDSVTVLTQRSRAGLGTPEAGPAGLRVERVWRRDDPRAAAHLFQALRSRQLDLLWFNAGLTMFGQSRLINFFGLMAPLLARRTGVPVVVTLHENVETTSLRQLGLQNGRVTHWGAGLAVRLLLGADAVVVTLRRQAQWLRTHYAALNVHHIALGAPAPVEVLPRPVTAPPQDVLAFTSLAPHRGLLVLAEAFQAVRAQLPAATLTIAGADHPRFAGYSAEVRARLAGQPGLCWAGAVSEAELRDLLARARVVVLPYLATTGASSVLYRAAAAGRPMVASDLPDLRATAEEVGLQVGWTPAGAEAALAQLLRQWLMYPAQPTAMARHNLEAMRALALPETSRRYAELLLNLARPA